MIKFWDKYIKIKYVWPLPKKTNLMKNKIYLLFAGFKTNYVTNKLKRSHQIVDHLF